METLLSLDKGLINSNQSLGDGDFECLYFGPGSGHDRWSFEAKKNPEETACEGTSLVGTPMDQGEADWQPS